MNELTKALENAMAIQADPLVRAALLAYVKRPSDVEAASVVCAVQVVLAVDKAAQLQSYGETKRREALEEAAKECDYIAKSNAEIAIDSAIYTYEDMQISAEECAAAIRSLIQPSKV